MKKVAFNVISTNGFISSSISSVFFFCGLKHVLEKFEFVAWLSWERWTSCSRTCGGGIREQTRHCQGADGCRGKRRKTEACHTTRCPC